jgi:regulator of sigma D
LDKKKVYVSLETIAQDIMSLRTIMYEVSKQVDCLSHPTLVNISQLIDRKLNERHHLMNELH